MHSLFSLIATGCYDGLIRIWKYDPYKRFATTIELTQDDDNLLHTLHGHHGAVNSICFDGNGTRMYSADGAGIIKIWNANDVMESDCPYEPFQCIKTVDAMQVSFLACLN